MMTKQLTSSDRMRAVLSGHIPDRVPFLPTIYIDHACLACGRRFEEALANPALGQECMLDAARRYRADAVRFCMGPPASWYEDCAVTERDGKLVQVSRYDGKLEGNYDPMLEDLLQVGVDAMDGIDPESGMSLRRTKAKIGDRITLMGGLSCLTLLRGTPEQVHKEAAQCVADGKPDGRYVLGSACAVPRHTPPENLFAARAAIDRYGIFSESNDQLSMQKKATS